MMQSLGRRYVQYINSKYQRTGTLWEGRYRSGLVDKDGYLAACSRYIELNPVRAKIVKYPDEYAWSSFRSKTTDKIEDFLDRDSVYFDMGKTDKERRNNYRKWVLEGIPEHEINLIRFATQKCGIIGSDTFRKKIEKKLGRSVALKPRGRPKKSL
jgi:putative transposase